MSLKKLELRPLSQLKIRKLLRHICIFPPKLNIKTKIILKVERTKLQFRFLRVDLNECVWFFFPVFLSNLACLFLFFRQFDVFCLVLLYILLLCKYFNYTYIFLHSVENPKIYSQNQYDLEVIHVFTLTGWCYQKIGSWIGFIISFLAHFRQHYLISRQKFEFWIFLFV